MEFNPAFTKNELFTFLTKKNIEEDDAKKLQDEKIDGETFQDLTENDLKEIGLKLGTRKKITKIIQNFKTSSQNSQPVIGNAKVQDVQILGSDSYMPNSFVFDLVAAGSTSCTVIPTVPSTSLVFSSEKTLAVPPKTTSNVSLLRKITVTRNSESSLLTDDTTSDDTAVLTTPIPSAPMLTAPVSCTQVPSTPVPSTRNSTTQLKRKSSIATKETQIPSNLYLESEDRVPGHILSTYADPDSINIVAMLNDHMAGRKILKNLKSGKGICKSEVSEIVRIVMRTMTEDLRTLYPTVDQKTNVAKAIVREIPELKSNRDGIKGYEQFYDPVNRTGSIEWRLKTMIKLLPESKKKRPRRAPTPKRKKPEGEEQIFIEEDVLQKIEWLKSQPALEINRTEIFQAMEDTFNIRRNFIVKRVPLIMDILEEFPKLKDFDGALIDAEFNRLYPNAENLLEVLPEYAEKIRIYVSQKRQDIVDRLQCVADENLKVLMYLADLLPTPGLCRRTGDDRSLHPSECLVTFTGENSTISQEDLTGHPKLLCCGEVQDEQLQFFLVLNKEYVDLGKCFLKAFDILYKAYYVFNVEYPKDLIVFYSFFDHMIYKVNTGAAKSSAEHLYIVLSSINTDKGNV